RGADARAAGAGTAYAARNFDCTCLASVCIAILARAAAYARGQVFEEFAMSRKLVAVGLLAAGFAVGAGTVFVKSDSSGPSLAEPAHAAAAATERGGSPTLLPDFTSIVERNGPAVVNISVLGEAQGPQLAP